MQGRVGIEARLRDQATHDETFRAALLADPRAAVGDALGIDIPTSLGVRVIEEGVGEVVLVIPALRPPVAEVSDAELEIGVGAGWTNKCSEGCGTSVCTGCPACM